MQVAVKHVRFHRSEAARQDVGVRVPLKAMVPLEVEEAAHGALVIDPLGRDSGRWLLHMASRRPTPRSARCSCTAAGCPRLRLRHPAYRVPQGRQPLRHARLSGRLQAQGARQVSRRPANRDAREAVGIEGPCQRRWCGWGRRILQAASIARFLYVLERSSRLRR
jgi:hypothetical protein